MYIPLSNVGISCYNMRVATLFAMNTSVSTKLRHSSFRFLILTLALAGIMSFTQSLTAGITVNTIDDVTIGLRFDRQVQSSGASQSSSYSLFTKSPSGGMKPVVVTSATLQSDEQTVALICSGPVGEFFAVGVSNILDLTNGPITDSATGYLSRYSTANIGDLTDPSVPGSVLPIYGDSFYMTANGSSFGGTNSTATNDHFQFTYQAVVGDFDIAVQIPRLDNSGTPRANAGLMARESLDAGSRMVATAISPFTGSDQLASRVRLVENFPAVPFGATISSNSYSWLRLTRSGTTFSTYFGQDGVSWSLGGSINLTLVDTLYVGTALSSRTNGINTTAAFYDLGIVGSRPGDSVTPTVRAKI